MVDLPLARDQLPARRVPARVLLLGARGAHAQAHAHRLPVAHPAAPHAAPPRRRDPAHERPPGAPPSRRTVQAGLHRLRRRRHLAHARVHARRGAPHQNVRRAARRDDLRLLRLRLGVPAHRDHPLLQLWRPLPRLHAVRPAGARRAPGPAQAATALRLEPRGGTRAPSPALECPRVPSSALDCPRLPSNGA